MTRRTVSGLKTERAFLLRVIDSLENRPFYPCSHLSFLVILRPLGLFHATTLLVPSLPEKDFMETLYIWLLIFAGAGLLLLGIFLFAADRKFGKHRRLVDASRPKHQFSESQRSEIR